MFRRTRKVKDEFGTATKDVKNGPSASSSGRSVTPSKPLAKKDSSEDGLEAYLEEAAGMVMPHRYVGINYTDIKILMVLSHRATRRRSGAKLRTTASTM